MGLKIVGYPTSIANIQYTGGDAGEAALFDQALRSIEGNIGKMDAIVFGISQEAGDERPDFAGP
jgi:hypothetical protein